MDEQKRVLAARDLTKSKTTSDRFKRASIYIDKNYRDVPREDSAINYRTNHTKSSHIFDNQFESTVII